MKVSFVLFSCAIATAWSACAPSARNGDDFGDDDGSGSGSGSNPGGSGVAAECNKMDIVFVVDDSGSMSEEQTNLHDNFPMFATVLSQYRTMDGMPLDFRVGVTTTGKDIHYSTGGGLFDEHGPNGAFEKPSGCGTGTWLDQTDANLMSDLSCRAKVGTSGASIEMPLLMAKRSVSDRIADTTNGTFLRDDALLAVVMITDEDDQSNTDDTTLVPLTGLAPNWNPSDEVQFFDTLKGNRTRWAAAVIAGETDCMSGLGSAVEATRLKEFVDDANSNSTQAVFSSICDGDLSIGLMKALDTFQTACGNIIF